MSSDDLYSPHREATHYPDFTDHEEFSGHPTPAKGPKLANTVAATASRSAPKSVPDKSSKPYRQRAKTPKLVYCPRCADRKSKPSTGSGLRNGNAVHKCIECKELRQRLSKQAERLLSKETAASLAQHVRPVRPGVSTAGKERPRPPKLTTRPPIKPIPGKRELVALPSPPRQRQDDGPEFDTESDDPDDPRLPHGRNPNVDRFGTAINCVQTNLQTPCDRRQQNPPSEPMTAVPKPDFYNQQGRPVFFDSAKAFSQHDGPSYPQLESPSPFLPPGTVDPAFLDNSHVPDAAGTDLGPELRTPPGHFEKSREALESSHHFETPMAPHSSYDGDGVDATAFLNNINLSGPLSVPEQAHAYAALNPPSISPESVPIDPAILQVPYGQVSDYIRRPHELAVSWSD